MKHRIQRSYLVRRVERWDISMPDEEDPQHFIDMHFHKFDDDLTGGMFDAVKVSEETVLIDYDELDLSVAERESAKVIQMRRKS